MKHVFFLSNCDLGEDTGRAEKFRYRIEFLKNNRWDVVYHKVSIANSDYQNAYKYLYAILAYKLICETFQAVRIAKKTKPEIIFSVNNPIHLHIIALVLSLFISKPWVAEFRDGIVKSPQFATLGRTKKTIKKLLEKAFVKKADRVAFFKGGHFNRDYFLKKYKSESESKFVELPYIGYDKDLIQKVPAKKFDTFTIIYAGSLYLGWIDPINFLTGLKKAMDITGITQDKIVVRFYTRHWHSTFQKIVEELNLKKAVEIYDPIPIDKLISVLKGADIHLYISGSKQTKPYVVFSKFFIYTGTGGSILALTNTKFQVAHLIKKYNLGFIADEYDKNEIANVLAGILRKKEKLQKVNLKDTFSKKLPEYVLLNVFNVLSKNC